jgi:long-chain acyl-CoA synthetase
MTQDPILLAFERLARRQGERPLVASLRRSASVADVDAQARALGERLGRELARDAVVGLAAPNGPAFLAGLLAVRRRGHAVALLDASAPEAELLRAAAGVGARTLLRSATGWPSSAADWTLLPTAPAEPGALPHLSGAPIIKVTSGSTGAAQGVVATAEALCADEAALFATMGLRDDERILASIPLSHSYGLSSIALPALLRGSLVLVPDDPGPLAPLAVARAAAGSFFPTVPAYLQGLVRLRRPEAWPASLRLVISAGAPLSPAVAHEFREVHGQPVHCFYGASECGGICYDREGGAAERGCVGTPVAGVALSLEPEPGQAEAEGTGAVVVRSPAVACGYLPEPDPRLSAGSFRTGDRACWSGGELRLLGRLDGLINVKGKKVDPGEVESVLATLDGVIEVIVLGVPSRLDGSQTVRAVVACRPNTISSDDVLAFCRARLAEHKVPRSVRLVSEIPRTPRGKIDRALLLEADAASRA